MKVSSCTWLLEKILSIAHTDVVTDIDVGAIKSKGRGWTKMEIWAAGHYFEVEHHRG